LPNIFIQGKRYFLILTKNGLGYILADYLISPSVHPDGDPLRPISDEKINENQKIAGSHPS
jgi:hypothetical protein